MANISKPDLRPEAINKAVNGSRLVAVTHMRLAAPTLLISEDGDFSFSTVGDTPGKYWNAPNMMIIKRGRLYYVATHNKEGGFRGFKITRLPLDESGKRKGVVMVVLTTDNRVFQCVISENPGYLTEHFCFAILDGVVALLAPPTSDPNR